MVAAAVGMQVVGLVPFASTFAAFMTRAFDFVRMAAISAREHPPLWLARRRFHRRGRSIADGPRGPRDDARRPWQHGPLPVRREPDRAPRRSDGRARRHQLPPHDTREDADPLHRPSRRVPRRREPHRAWRAAGRRRRRDRGGHHRPRGGQGRRSAEGDDQGPRDRRVLGEADRFWSLSWTRCETPAGDSASWRTTGPRVGSATRCWRRSPRAVVAGEIVGFRHLAVRAMPGSGKPDELLEAAGISAKHIADAVKELAGSGRGR